MFKNIYSAPNQHWYKIALPVMLFGVITFIASCKNNSTSVSSTIEEEEESKTSVHELLEIGDSISFAAQNELLKNVGREMKAGGPTAAISFCNIHASPIMDSLSKVYGVEIHRITERSRNPNNKANDVELAILKAMQSSASNDTVILSSNTYYKNIYLGMETCLKCHGNKEQISPETQELITEKYPKDEATNYQLGDLRGAWKIVFK